MLKNYLRIAWRSLTTSKTYSLINIVGLAIGLTACMLIMLYAAHEWSYDRFHKSADRIYLVQVKLDVGSDPVYIPYMTYSAAEIAKNSTPFIEQSLRVKPPERDAVLQNVESPSLKFTENQFVFADSNFFNFFSFRLIKGDKSKVLQHPFSVVLSRAAATKYFGKEDPIGKIIRYNNTYDFVVTGVAEETPSNSSIAYDFIAPVSSLLSMDQHRELLQNDEKIFSTYFLVKHSFGAPELQASLQQLSQTTEGENRDRKYIAIPLKDIRSYSNIDKSNTKYLMLFPAVAGLILLLAIFNYISLTTARSSVRAKEIGVRKVLGASRRNLTLQFFLESILYTTIAFVLGYILCLLLQPFFFGFLEMELNTSFLYNSTVVITLLILYVITVLLSAIYPSILLSAFRPASVLYGKLSGHHGGLNVRKFVTVFQFAISIILVTCSIIIQRQISFVRNAETGIDRNNVMMIPFGANVGKNYPAFKKELQSLSSVQKVSGALNSLYKGYNMMGVKPKNTNEMILLPTLMVDQHFIALLNLRWKTPPVDLAFHQNLKDAAVLNETAVEKLNLGPHAVGQNLDGEFTVAGVLRDFNFTSLQNKIEPLSLFIVQDSDTSALWAHQGGCFYLKVVNETNVAFMIDKLKAIYEKYEREKPFEVNFMDDAYAAQYKAEDRLSKILNAFTAFAVLIASLGLFGLATFMVARRTKEIGVRKVLGASVKSVVLLLSKDFIKLVVLAIVIATPIAVWAVNGWLQSFAYRINIEWWMFAFTGLFVVGIALLAVSYHSIKAAVADPAKVLRTD